jgi:hypothetical protein
MTWLKCQIFVPAPISDGASITDLLSPAIISGEMSVIAECD